MVWKIDHMPEEIKGNDVYEHLYKKAVQAYSRYVFSANTLHKERRNHVKGSKARDVLFAENDFWGASATFNTMVDVLTLIVLNGSTTDYRSLEYLKAESYVKLAIASDAECVFPILAKMKSEVHA